MHVWYEKLSTFNHYFPIWRYVIDHEEDMLNYVVSDEMKSY